MTEKDQLVAAVPRTCIEPKCQASFFLTEGEVAFFSKRVMAFPRRCRPCRAKRRPLAGGMYHPLGGDYGAPAQRP